MPHLNRLPYNTLRHNINALAALPSFVWQSFCSPKLLAAKQFSGHPKPIQKAEFTKAWCTSHFSHHNFQQIGACT
jgi:hypothetical protein